MERVGEGRIEIYDMDILFSDEDKERFLQDPPEYLKELLEREGHKVNRLFVTTDFASRAREEKTTSQGATAEGDMRAHWFHIVYPANEQSGWICA
jgi:hypothetical protein